MVTIEDYLYDVYEDFKRYVDGGSDLCDLKSLNFQAGQLPDYSDIHIQQFYLLRFAFAYMFEYMSMFEDLLKKHTFGKDINVVSVGCGAMLDYWALKRQMQKLGMEECKIHYRGLDLIDWGYKIPAEPNDDVKFIQGNAADFLRGNSSINADIYLFPKSISEFSEKEFTTICDCFANKPIKQEWVHILFSLRSDERSLTMDIDRTEKLHAALRENGYETEAEARTYTYYTDSQRGVKGYNDEFNYPNETYEFLRNLRDCCAVHADGECLEEDCAQYLNRSPILTVGNIRYQIYSFKRI